MSENGQTHSKNLAVFVAKFLKCVWPFWDITCINKGLKYPKISILSSKLFLDGECLYCQKST